jgi:hypothetical protein
MKILARYLAQAVLYGAFNAFIGYFSTSPAYTHLPPDQALIRLSFSHAAQRKVPCHERTPEELAKLAPNMRAQFDCPRERAPVTVELEMDGQLLYHLVVPPSGLAKDGASTVYRRVPVAAGSHRFKLRLADAPNGEFNYLSEKTVDLKPARILVIDFSAAQGGFLFLS